MSLMKTDFYESMQSFIINTTKTHATDTNKPKYHKVLDTINKKSYIISLAN